VGRPPISEAGGPARLDQDSTCFMSREFSHFDRQGASRMVDVGTKDATTRRARARAVIQMAPDTSQQIRQQALSKGDVLEVARLAGIMAAKRTADLIPLCHSLPLDAVSLSLEFDGDSSLIIEATVQTTARTGVEMEALVSVSVAALTVYDMCKSIDRAMTIGPIYLQEKSGGQSGHFLRTEDSPRQQEPDS